MYIKVDEKNWGLFQTNNHLILFLNIVRMSDDEGCLITTINQLVQTCKIDNILNTLDGLVAMLSYTNSNDYLTIKVKSIGQWRGGSGVKKTATKQAKKVVSIDEQRFNEGMQRTYPRVQQLKQPLTLADWNDLINNYPVDKMKEILVAMENWKPLLEKRVSAKATIVAWYNYRIKKGL